MQEELNRTGDIMYGRTWSTSFTPVVFDWNDYRERMIRATENGFVVPGFPVELAHPSEPNEQENVPELTDEDYAELLGLLD